MQLGQWEDDIFTPPFVPTQAPTVFRDWWSMGGPYSPPPAQVAPAFNFSPLVLIGAGLISLAAFAAFRRR